MATLNTLKKKLKGYKHAEMVARDIATVVANFTNLKIQDRKQFEYSSGKKENCVSVFGTIPVMIRGTTYNIPIILWLHPHHPHQAPVVYVLPTGGMALQPSQFVDLNGLVHLPYLNFWQNTSDLSALCQILCSTFTEYCPVYTKPRSPGGTTSKPPSPRRLVAVMTDVAFLSNKEKIPPGFILVENTQEGKSFTEGRQNRYLCYCMKLIPGSESCMVVTDFMVLPVGDHAPDGYHPVNSTRDDGVQAFKKKQLLIRLQSEDVAKETVCEIQLVKGKKIPEGFKQLPDINGVHICFKTATLARNDAASCPLTNSIGSRSTCMENTQTRQLTNSIDRSVLQLGTPTAWTKPRGPAPVPPSPKTNPAKSDREIKEMKERNAQLQQQLQMSENRVRELEQKCSQLESGNHEEVGEEALYVNVQRDVLFGARDAQWKVERNEVRIIKEIGRGASGLVSEGSYRGQQVAVKQIHQSIMEQQHVMDEFKREVRIMANIQHPNLVRFIGAVFDEGVENLTATPLLLLELLQTNLRRAYENSNLDSVISLSIFRDVAYGLHYLHAHQQPIIHRDVSAPNILLEALPGGMWRAKLSDFGSANFLKWSKTPGVGAIVYTAPEMFPRQDPSAPMPRATVKCDVFSYGIVLAEVVTRSMPTPDNRHVLFREVQRKWPSLHQLIQQCTQLEPNSRPTMYTVLNTLHLIPTTDSYPSL